jgi:hypothetical protein
MIPPLTKEELLQIHNRYKPNPKLYFKEVLGVEKTWELQDKLIEACPRAIKEHKAIYVASGHSLGKDYISAGIGLWFLQNYVPSIVIETASTDRQVKKIMWGETLNHWKRKKINLGGTPYTDPYLEIEKSDWYLLGFTTKETGASAESGGGKFQGFHSPNICIIASEAQALEDLIFDQIEGLTTPENVLVVYIGNPTRASGNFAKGLKDKTNNIVFNFSCLDDPNYKERRTVIPGLASYEWVEDKRRKWGEDDPRWYGRVLGQIPPVSINNIFSQEVIDLMLRNNEIGLYGTNAGVAIDVAGEGDDSNAIYAGRNGNVLDSFFKLNQSPGLNALKCHRMCKDVKGNFIIVDCDGIGIGVWQEIVTEFKEFSEKVAVVKYHGSSTMRENEPSNTERPQYFNLRAKAWFTALQRAKDGVAAIPNDQELIDELLEVKYFENKKGMLQLEDKDDVKERLGRSPNKADAWVMLQWGYEQNYPNAYYEEAEDFKRKTNEDFIETAQKINPLYAETMMALQAQQGPKSDYEA